MFIGVALSVGICRASHAQDAVTKDAVTTDVKFFTEAAVVLTTGTILTGTLVLYPERQVLALKSANDSTYTLPARLVRGFAAKDAPDQQRAGDTYLALQRIFRVFPLPATKSTSPVAWGFYEQLSRGPGVVLLRRERAVGYQESLRGNFPGSNGLATQTPPMITFFPGATIITLYLATVAGAVVPLRKPQDVFKHFPAMEPQLRAYVRENGLNLSNDRELSFLVNHANSLAKPTP
ncbi:hypothetical protein ACFP2F_16165 [Hymenobacter artigasi]|uniref:Uncharacterized protein n=1 Tax=Hymenobacter artigasi TaxID=2719616 RepID=A0ABX1HI58_9BACT|nr:hypothetical protein [Hymenobacter artigasi]NKI89885.1 hypothetical protein [Hymenobacter artigasi]